MLAPRSLLLSAALAALVLAPAASAASCSSYSTRYGKNLDGVCVCTAASCDEVSNDYLTLTSDQVGVFQTSKGGDRLSYTTVPAYAANSTAAASNVVEVTVDSSVTYQKITGFGGAFTDTTTSNVYKMSSTLQDKIVSAYFGDKGIQYTLGRVPIGSTDFSESIYSYNPVEGDLDMVNFSIDIDKSASTHKIEFIKRALAASSRAVPLFASSWAPPVWMTREKSVLGNATVIGEPGEPYWKALALYYSRFFDEYKKEGINFWAMTTQNEPSYQFAFLEWQQLRFTTEQERDFIKKDLGPLMKKNHPDLKIIMMDDQKDLLPTWRAALEDPEARQYVSGVGVHWYKNIDFIADGLGNFQQLADFNAKYPDIFILPSEACSGSMPSIIGTGAGVRIQEPDIIWKRAENYARDIINDLANFAVGWTDWNMVLDTTGGPTWVGNFVDAPIIIDEKSGNEFYKQPMYYIMGHVAKFLPAGSQRVALSAPKASGNVDRVAFRTPAGQLVVILQNRDASPVSLKVSDTQGKVTTSVTLPANSVQTILFAAPGATTPAPTTTAPATTAPATTVPATTAPVTTAPATTTPATTAPATTPCPLPTPTEPATTPVTTPVSTPVTTPVTTPVSTPVTTPVATSVTTPCPLPSPTTPATTTPAPTRSYC